MIKKREPKLDTHTSGERIFKRRPTVLMFALALMFVQALEPSVNYGVNVSQTPTPSEADTISRITILASGDAMAHLPQTEAAYDTATKSYRYGNVFKWLEPIIHKYDVRFINLETPLAGKPYRGYPQFSAPDEYASDLFDAGFNFFACANNHSVDRYNSGILRTIKVLDSLRIPHMGIYSDSIDRANRYPFIIEKNGIKLAVLNATYGTNGLKAKPPVLVNYINKEQILVDIQQAGDKDVDAIIAIMHWGDEYKLLPNNYQTNIAKFLVQNGVDIIIGHHPHVLQPIGFMINDTAETAKEIPVIWSLGNFFSNQRDKYRDGGMLVGFTMEKNKITSKIAIKDLHYYPFWVRKKNNPLSYCLIPSELPLNLLEADTLSDAEQLSFKFFSDDARKRVGKNGECREMFFYTAKHKH